MDGFAVWDNVYDCKVRTFPEREEAVWLCRGMNLDEPGGRYGVRVREGDGWRREVWDDERMEFV